MRQIVAKLAMNKYDRLMQKITCPHCGKPVEISEALTKEIEEQTLAALSEKHQKELEAVKADALAQTTKKLQEQFALQLKQATQDNIEKEAQNKKLYEQLEKLLEEKTALKREKDEMKFEMQKKLAEEEDKIRLDAQKKAEEEQHLKMLAKDKQLQDTLKELEDARRKLQQGSQQTQGEVLELEIEKFLQQEFPNDKITAVGKGVRGGDIIQEVWDSRGNYNGKILWELKNTTTWKEEWIAKLKADQRAISAEEVVLISEVMPKDITTAGFRNGVWVTQRTFVIGLASALRAKLIQLYYVKASSKGKNEKMEILYEYLSGTEFKHRIEAIIEAFTNMQTEIEKEKRYFSNKWARDEKNIRQVIDSTYGMHGDLRGIIGNTLAQVKGLELLEDGE